MNDTLTLLKQHHKGDTEFVELMKNSAANRFDHDFWEAWIKWIVPVLSDVPQIADFGCGPGMLLRALHERYPQAHLIGVEYAPYMLDVLDSDLYRIIEHDLHRADISIAANSLDAIALIYCIHELNQPITILKTAYDALKPGGRCFIMDWVRVPLTTYLASQVTQDIFTANELELKEIFTHFNEHNRYCAEDVSGLLQKIGFTLLEQTQLKSEQFVRWLVEK